MNSNNVSKRIVLPEGADHIEGRVVNDEPDRHIWHCPNGCDGELMHISEDDARKVTVFGEPLAELPEAQKYYIGVEQYRCMDCGEEAMMYSGRLFTIEVVIGSGEEQRRCWLYVFIDDNDESHVLINENASLHTMRPVDSYTEDGKIVVEASFGKLRF